mgnify:CR=1 FL=1
MAKIPFNWLPGSWGLKGKTFEIAKAEYELTGAELERRLIEINRDSMSELQFQLKMAEWSKKHGLINEQEFERQCLELEKTTLTEKDYKVKLADFEKKYGIIDEFDHLRKLASLVEDETRRELMLLDIDYKAGKIKQIEYEKKFATLNKEPWVNVLEMNFGGTKSLEGSFELDWNEYFVENLKKEGYQGPTPDSIVNQWFMEVCRNIALEEFDGTGDFTADSAANLETVKRWSSEGRREYK